LRHPDNANAVAIASSYDAHEADRRKELVEADIVEVSEEQSMVLLGSPTAEGFSRVLFGYSRAGPEDSLRQTEAPLDLPFRWELDAAQIDAKAYRYVRDRGLVSRPNWRVVDQRTGHLYIPETRNEDHLLVTDYLLVTRLRNFATQAALDSGHYVVSFGGTHGTGTRAIDLVLSDRSVLRKVSQALRGKRDVVAYQLLFAVGNMLHDPDRGTRARKIDLVDAVLLDDSEERWRTAQSVIRPRLAEWLAQ
jgi:hypothetical protein